MKIEETPNAPTGALARLAPTGIYLLRGVPRALQREARVRAVHEGTTLRSVLLQALREYAAGTWRPQREAVVPGPPPTLRADTSR